MYKKRNKVSKKEVERERKRYTQEIGNRSNTNESLSLIPSILSLSIFFSQPLFTSLLGRGISLYQNKWVFVKILHLSVIAGNQRNSMFSVKGPITTIYG